MSQTKKVILRTSDNKEFELEEKLATRSITIKNIMEDVSEDNSHAPIPLPDIPSKVFVKILEYLKTHGLLEEEEEVKIKKEEGDSDDINAEKLPADETKEKKDSFAGENLQELLELVVAAHFLEIKDLSENCCVEIADRIKNKSPEAIRKIFNITNDFTEEEEVEIRRQHEWAHEDMED